MVGGASNTVESYARGPSIRAESDLNRRDSRDRATERDEGLTRPTLGQRNRGTPHLSVGGGSHPGP